MNEQLYFDFMKEWRAKLHQLPELSYHELHTSKLLKDFIAELNAFKIQEIGPYSFVASIKGLKVGEYTTKAFRTEMDALPVEEDTSLEFASKNKGVMHACGHDGHMAIVLGLAKYLAENQNKFGGKIKLIFQSAEEIPPGGAIEIVNSGVLRDVDDIYGFHLFPYHPVGDVGIVSGPVTASQDIFRIQIRGKGTHGAYPEKGVDTILVAAQIINSINHITSRNISAFDNAIVSLGQVHSGEVFNVIPDTAFLEGNIRTTSSSIRHLVKQNIIRVVEGIAKSYGATAEVLFQQGYSPVVNAQSSTDKAEHSGKKVLGNRRIFTNARKMVSEDFSAYTDNLNGCFMILGGGIPEDGYRYMNHHPKFNFDERALLSGLKIFIDLACQ